MTDASRCPACNRPSMIGDAFGIGHYCTFCGIEGIWSHFKFRPCPERMDGTKQNVEEIDPFGEEKRLRMMREPYYEVEMLAEYDAGATPEAQIRIDEEARDKAARELADGKEARTDA